MAGRIDARLSELGLTIPDAPVPAANYVPFVIAKNMVYVAGQLPFVDGKVAKTGKVGQDLDTPAAKEIARICAINIVAQVKTACGGDLDRVVRCVEVGGFVNCIDGYAEQPEVLNGASDLMVEVFGDAGRHARFAVGTNALPRNVPVEVKAVFEIS